MRHHHDNDLLPAKNETKVFVYSESVSMAYSFPMLTELIQQWRGVPKFSENSEREIYVFVNETRTYCKVLFWHNGGPCILAKRLFKGKFQLDLGSKTITISELGKALTPVLPVRKGLEVIEGGRKKAANE